MLAIDFLGSSILNDFKCTCDWICTTEGITTYGYDDN